MSGLQGGSARTETWTEERFSASRAEWQELLGRSDADPLFMSWDWQWCWWKHVGRKLGSELVLIAVLDGESRLRALAPFHLRRVQHRAGLQAMRLESLGSTFRAPTEVFTEYVDVIVDREFIAPAVAALARHLREDTRWGDLVLGNVFSDGIAARMVREELGDSLVRDVDPLEAHAVQLPPRFDDYLKALPGSVRRKLWNQRSKIPGVVLEYTHEVADSLDWLDGFQRERWGQPHYHGIRREFHLEFASSAAQRGELFMSRLIVDDRTISATYDIRKSGREYNLQAGFDNKVSGYSPGYLHFGYSMERACADGVQVFDFLAGEGRNRQYKQDFLTTARTLTTLQVVRSTSLSLLYRGHDLLRSVGSRFRMQAAQ
jgi:hypothetical protein